MRHLRFRRLRIFSDQERRGADYEFGRQFNVVVGKTNSVGKSSLVKSLFWTLGCDPFLDPDFVRLDCRALVDIEIDGRELRIGRHGDRIFVGQEGGRFRVYPKITGEYSEYFAQLVNFSVLLPVRDKQEIEAPPPAYYFLPFYINQTYGWGKAWSSFDKLGQYADWKRELVPFHVGIFRQEYFSLTSQIFESRRSKEQVDQDIARMDAAVELVSELIPPTAATFDVQQFDNVRRELTEDVAALHGDQERLFESIASMRAEKQYLVAQHSIALRAVEELAADYDHALNHEDEIECPTCGTLHDNSLVRRFSLLGERDQASEVVERLATEMQKWDKEIARTEKDLDSVRAHIIAVDEKYCARGEQFGLEKHALLEAVAASSVTTRIGERRKNEVLRLHELEQGQKLLIARRKASAEANRKAVNKRFTELYPSFVQRLHAYGVNAGAIKGPMDYNKVAKSGGDAERTRAMLAYYIAIYNLVAEFSEEALSAIVIDTPNQHEQAIAHYGRIIELIMKDAPAGSQIFLCGMDSPELEPLKQKAKVIRLDAERGLLQESQYQRVRDDIGAIFEVASQVNPVA